MESLSLAYESGSARLYRIGPAEPGALESYVATTPGTRAICNDPTVAGVRYTRLLREACTEILRALAPDIPEDRCGVYSGCAFVTEDGERSLIKGVKAYGED